MQQSYGIRDSNRLFYGKVKAEGECLRVELHGFRKLGTAAVRANAAHLVIEAEDDVRAFRQLVVVLLCGQLLLRVMREIEGDILAPSVTVTDAQPKWLPFSCGFT